MIKLFKVVLRENPLDSPFAPKNKCDDWGSAASAAAASMASLASSLAAAEANSEDVEATNQMNYKIAHENNEISQQQFERNMQWLRYQFEQNRKYAIEDRDYNAPHQVVQRLLQAGINPSSYFGSGQTQIASSQGVGAPSPSNLHTPEMKTKNVGGFIADMAPHAINAFNEALMFKQQMALTDSQISYSNARAEYEWQSMRSKLEEQVNRANKGSVEYLRAKRDLDLFNETYNSQKSAIEQNARLVSSNVKKVDVEVTARKIENDILRSDLRWRDKMNEASYKSLLIGIKKVVSEIAVNNRDAALKSAQKAVEEARKKGMDISNEQADELMDFIIERADYEAEEANYNAGKAGREFYQGKGAMFPTPSDVDTPKSLYRRSRRYPIHYDGR